MPLKPIAEIKIGRRHREDFGDVDSLARSIADISLLHPIAITPDGKLIAGARRLKAFKQLGRDKIPVTVIDLEKVVLGEYAENAFRKSFTPSEMVAIADAIEPIERARAKAEQQKAGERGKEGGRGRKKTLVGNSRKGKRAPTALDKVARATGKDRRTLEKARAVVQAAKAKPKKFGHLQTEMDESGSVDHAFKALKIIQERESYEARRDRGAKVADLLAMAKAGQKFAVIHPDCPWEFHTYSGKGKQRSAERYYDVSSIEALKALPVAPLAAKDSALFLWAVWPELPGALELIKAWGFEYKTVAFVWVKQVSDENPDLHMGMGYWTRSNTEICLLATKGNPQRMAMDVPQVILAPVGPHSAKPEEARRRIERLFIGPYLELFARQPVEGWTVWGNEIIPAEAAE
jgi:N6-adenosine-specific RNA methylase IME4/ParB-like chromosome segregation protein Spo0J